MKENRRTAILISGQLRDFKVNAQNQIKQLFEGNNVDVFVYACTKNMIHTLSPDLTGQEYSYTKEYKSEQLNKTLHDIYGEYLKVVKINDNELSLDTYYPFGTIGYFKQGVDNQFYNIRQALKLADDRIIH